MASVSNMPSRIDLHMHMAWMWSRRSKCKRVARGCVVTTEDMTRILSIGYNGPAPKLDNDRCRDEPGKCGCLHAEDNAIAMVDGTISNKVIFCTCMPCEMCAQRIIRANVTAVFYEASYREDVGMKLLIDAGLSVFKVVPSHRITTSDELGRAMDHFRYDTLTQG